MKNKLWMVLFAALALSACSSNKGLKKETSRDKAEAASHIKTQLAVEYMNIKDYRLAVSTIEEAIQADNKNAIAWLVRAEIYQYLKTYDKAEESFSRALSLRPDSAEINNNYGWFLCSSRNQPNASIPYFDKALSDPTYPTPQVAYMNKGICSAKMGQYSLAESYLERAIAADPQFSPALREMARSKLLAGEATEADHYFRQYQSRTENMSEDDLFLGWRIAQAHGNSQAAYEYEVQLRAKYPYSEQLKSITTGNTGPL